MASAHGQQRSVFRRTKFGQLALEPFWQRPTDVLVPEPVEVARPEFPSRPHVRDRDDPLTIPADALQARPSFCLPMPYRRSLLWVLTLLSMTGFYLVLAIGFRVAGPWLASDFILSLIALFTVFCIYCTYFGNAPQVVAGPWLIFLFLLAMFFIRMLSGGAFAGLLSLIAIGSACVLADQMASNYAAWLLANPRVSRKGARRCAKLWRGRFSRSPELPGHTTGLAIVGFVVLGSLLLAVCFAPPTLSGVVFVTLLVLGLVAASIASLLLSRSGFILALNTVWDAICNWMYYNEHAKEAPGCYQSPFGHSRINRVLLTTLLLAVSLPPLALYFPLHRALIPGTPWLEVAEGGWPWQSEHTLKFENNVLDANRARLEQLARYRPDQVEAYGKRILDGERTARAYQRLHGCAEGWMLVAIRGIFTGDPRFVWSLVFGILPTLTVGPVILVCTWVIVLGRSVPAFADCVDGAIQREGCDFDHHVARLQRSGYQFPDGAYERDHLWLGVDTAYRRPILLHRDLLEGHAHILGSTRSGKTSLCLAPMLAQMIRSLNPKAEGYNNKSSIVILDLKGEPSLFHGVRQECADHGVAFKFFTNRYGCATHAFNPFEQQYLRHLSPEQRVSLLARSIGIFYGHEYPEVFWSDVNAQVFRTLLLGYPDIRSFAQFYYFASDLKYYRAIGGNPDDWKTARHVRSATQEMAQVIPLNVTRAESPLPDVHEERIDMSTLGSNQHAPQVVYFFMRTLDEESVAYRVAKLALFSVLTALNAVPDEQKRRTYVVIDEFQVVALDILAKLFEQAAGLKVSYVLSNQSLHTLPELLQEVLQENTAFRQIFRAGSSTAREYLRDRCGTTIYDFCSRAALALDVGIPEFAPIASIGEVYGYYYTPADIVATSYNPLTSWVEMSSGKGFSRYGGDLFELESDFHITYDEHQRRERLPWPEKTTSTLIAAEEKRLLDGYATGPAAQVDARAPEIRAVVPVKEGTTTGAASLFESRAEKPALRPVRPYLEFDEAVAVFEQARTDLQAAIECGEPYPAIFKTNGDQSHEPAEPQAPATT